jgi:hypothetical protein
MALALLILLPLPSQLKVLDRGRYADGPAFHEKERVWLGIVSQNLLHLVGELPGQLRPIQLDRRHGCVAILHGCARTAICLEIAFHPSPLSGATPLSGRGVRFSTRPFRCTGFIGSFAYFFLCAIAIPQTPSWPLKRNVFSILAGQLPPGDPAAGMPSVMLVEWKVPHCAVKSLILTFQPRLQVAEPECKPGITYPEAKNSSRRGPWPVSALK